MVILWTFRLKVNLDRMDGRTDDGPSAVSNVASLKELQRPVIERLNFLAYIV